MAALLRVLFFVLLFFVIRYVWAKLVALLGLSSTEQPRTITGHAYKDPQCGTYVAEELAVKALSGGQQHYFCSAECRDHFLADKS